jgi:hypothetical protein
MISNTTNYSPAFGANLKVDVYVKDKARLSHIQNLFSQKTTHYPNDTLRLSINPDCNSLQGSIITEGRDHGCQILPRSINAIMRDISDNDVAKKLVKFFKSIKIEENAKSVDEALETRRDSLISKSVLNKYKSEALKAEGDEKMSEAYKMMSDRNISQAKKLDAQREETKNHAIDLLEKIAEGDKDLMSSFSVTSSVM